MITCHNTPPYKIRYRFITQLRKMEKEVYELSSLSLRNIIIQSTKNCKEKNALRSMLLQLCSRFVSEDDLNGREELTLKIYEINYVNTSSFSRSVKRIVTLQSNSLCFKGKCTIIITYIALMSSSGVHRTNDRTQSNKTSIYYYFCGARSAIL